MKPARITFGVVEEDVVNVWITTRDPVSKQMVVYSIELTPSQALEFGTRLRGVGAHPEKADQVVIDWTPKPIEHKQRSS